MDGQNGHDTIATQFLVYGCNRRPLTSQLNVAYIYTQLYGSFTCLAYFSFDMYVCSLLTTSSMDVGRTRRYPTFDQLVQELNVFTEKS